MLIETLQHTIQHYKLFAHGARVIVAVSGGLDSIAMLHALVQLQHKFQYHLHVATLDHQLRASSADDAQYVARLAQQYGIACTVGQADVRGLAQIRQEGIESTARFARYQFLRQVAQDQQASIVVTAHHQYDQSETILHHIMRGAGLQGLTGMRLISPMPFAPDIQLVRPFLMIAHPLIELYCAQNNLVPREDETNASTDYLRNAIRLELLPQLRQYNPQFDNALTRLADNAQTDLDFIEDHFQTTVLPKVTHAERITVAKQDFLSWHEALQRRFITWAVTEMGGEPTHERILASINTLTTAQSGAVIQFVGAVNVTIDHDKLYIQSAHYQPDVSRFLLIDQPHRLMALGDYSIDDWSLLVTDDEPAQYSMRVAIDPLAQIILRPRQSGDIFYPHNLKGQSTTIKKWMINHKIPQLIRHKVPLLVINDHIMAIIMSDQWIFSHQHQNNLNAQRYLYFYARKIAK